MDPDTEAESVLTNDRGKPCTLTLPCTVDGLAAISAVCPPAVPPSQVPNECPAACSEIVDPWYTECNAMSPESVLAIDTQMNGEFVRFAELCDPRLQAPVIIPAPPPAPNGVVGGESGRECFDEIDNDGDGSVSLRLTRITDAVCVWLSDSIVHRWIARIRTAALPSCVPAPPTATAGFRVTGSLRHLVRDDSAVSLRRLRMLLSEYWSTLPLD